MTVAADILVYGATRIGSAIGYAMRHLPAIIATLGAWAVLSAWMMTRAKRE